MEVVSDFQKNELLVTHISRLGRVCAQRSNWPVFNKEYEIAPVSCSIKVSYLWRGPCWKLVHLSDAPVHHLGTVLLRNLDWMITRRLYPACMIHLSKLLIMSTCGALLLSCLLHSETSFKALCMVVLWLRYSSRSSTLDSLRYVLIRSTFQKIGFDWTLSPWVRQSRLG